MSKHEAQPEGKALRVRRTLTIETVVPFSEETYPDMTLDEAIGHEKLLPEEDKWEAIQMAVAEKEPSIETEVEIVDAA